MQDERACTHSLWWATILGAQRTWNKLARLDEGQQEDEQDEGEGFCSTSVQPKLMTIREAILSLENVAAFIEDKECTSEATQVCHITDLAAVNYGWFFHWLCISCMLKNIITCATNIEHGVYTKTSEVGTPLH